MALKCFMCGTQISHGILCDKCDKPRKTKQTTAPAPEASAPAPTPAPPAPARAPEASVAPPRPAAPPAATMAAETNGAMALDPFPKAPVVPFPVESASPAITSLVSVLIAVGVPTVLLGPDRSVKFVSDEAKKLFDASQAEMTLKHIESTAGIHIGDLTIPASQSLHVRNRNVHYTLVPLSGGASGAVLVFRYDGGNESRASFVTFVRETVFTPLRALQESMAAAARSRQSDPLLEDAAATLDQIVSSLEMAPEVEEPAAARVPSVSDVVRRVSERFTSFADLKGIQLQVDVPELEERFRDHEQLAEALGILMDNSLHYVPAGGQVVIGVRWMEHKGKPLLLFFVMDNGPLVPESLRQTIFEPGFTWNPGVPERTGRGLFKIREFALAHGGQVWAESKTGKACTFFLRVRPDGAR